MNAEEYIKQWKNMWFEYLLDVAEWQQLDNTEHLWEQKNYIDLYNTSVALHLISQTEDILIKKTVPYVSINIKGYPVSNKCLSKQYKIKSDRV